MTPEPWLRGPVPGVHPLVAPILYAFQQAREDLAHWTGGLTRDQLWSSPRGIASPGFHIRHIAGSTHRLITYLQNRSLSPEQLAELEDERRPLETTREDLLAKLEASLAYAEEIVRAVDPATLPDGRFIGRKRLPTTVIGLLTHIAEHTQRHVGQAITAAQFARWDRSK